MYHQPIGFSATIASEPRSSASTAIRIGPAAFASRPATRSYSDLQAAVLDIEKTNINDVFQLDHAARLYQLLYPVASFQRRRSDDPMQDAVDEYRRQVRQAVFDRLSVGYLVSDQFESDPGWPQAAGDPARRELGHPAQSVGAATCVRGSDGDRHRRE